MNGQQQATEYPPAVAQRLRRLRRMAGTILIGWAPAAYGVYWMLEHGAAYPALDAVVFGRTTAYVLLASAAYVSIPLLAIAAIYFIYIVYRIGEIVQRESTTADGSSSAGGGA